jgi:hypothetical protein
MNSPNGKWLRLGQKVVISSTSETGVIASYLGDGLVSVKLDRGADSSGIDHVLVHWNGLTILEPK